MILKTIWGNAMYAWSQKQSAIISIVTYNPCQFLSIAKTIYQWILSFAYQFDGLKGRELWFNPCHRSSAPKNSSLQASQGHHQRPRLCWSHNWRSNEASRTSKLNCHWLGIAFYLKVLVIAMLFPRHQAEAIHCLSLIDGQPDWEAK